MTSKKGVYIVNKDYKIVYFNDVFRALYPDVKENDTCYRVLGRIDHPCKNCPKFSKKSESTFYNKLKKEWIKASACSMDWCNEKGCTAIYFNKWEDRNYFDTLREGRVNQLINRMNTENPNQGILSCYYIDKMPIFYINNKFVEILGYDSYDEFMRDTDGKLINIMSNDDIRRSEDYASELIRDGMVYSTVFDLRCKNGLFKKAFVKGQIIKDEMGAVVFVSQLADLTDSYSTQQFLDNENRSREEKNQLLEYIDEVFPGGYIKLLYDDGLTIAEMSQRFLDITGYTASDIKILFKGLYVNLCHPEDLATIMQETSSRFEVDKILSFTYRLKHKTKGYIWVNNTTRCCKLNEERFFQSAILDVTEEINKKFELEKQNLQLNLVVSNLPGGFSICHNDKLGFEFIYVSTELAKLFGYTVAELIELTENKSINIAIPDDRMIKDQINDAFAHSDEYKVRYRVKCKNGTIKTVLDYGKKITDKTGSSILYSFLLDITEEEENKILINLQNQLIERERERAIEREQGIKQMELIQALAKDFSTVNTLNLDTMEVGLVYSMDPLHSQEMMREYYKKHLYDESMVAYIRDYIYKDDKEAFSKEISIEGLRRNMRERTVFTFNYRKVVNSLISYYQIKVVRLKSFKNGNVIIGYKNVDEETKKMMRQKEILRDALTAAQYANRAKTTFLSNMSHDIRTPMNAIIGYTALAAAHLDNKDRLRDYFKKINQSSNHLLSLINDVLDMSRIESGKIKIDNQPERLSDIIHNIRNIIETNINSRSLSLKIETINVMDEYIYCDKLRLNQMLLNLLSNSMKFTKPGGKITLKLIEHEHVSPNVCHYEFIVSDTGIGMSKEFQSHIFEPFVREKSSTVSGIQGTGLGMAITKSIVDMLGGTIRLESEEGKGSTFYININLELQHDNERHILELKRLKDLRALVVDDDVNTCKSVSRMLREVGMRSEWTMYGREALQMTYEAIDDKDLYNVYIIDWLMPDMSGIETVRGIRRALGDNASIIILSAYDWTEIEDEAREAGVDQFLNKPLFLSDLERAILSTMYPLEYKEEEKEPISKELFKGKRLLLAEDNEFNQEIAKEILESVGFSVDTADNGKLCCDMLESKPHDYYNAILMDIQMPVMDGYKACSYIRGLDDQVLSSIPIIAMTANAFLEDRQKTIDAGMNGFISKPISIDKLIDTLKRTL